MEHGLILLIEAILAADRNLQRPLAKHLPDLDRLRADPRGYLAAQEVLIGPRRATVLSVVLGLLAGVVVLVMGIALRADQPKPKPIEFGDVLLTFASVTITVIVSTVLLRHWMRGGSAVLSASGVQLLYRRRTVFCPWTTFQTPGTPYRPDHNCVILPVNGNVPVGVTVGRDADVEAMPASELSGKPLAVLDEQATLHDLYEVRAVDFGELLLYLGNRLGDGPSAALAASPRERGPLGTAEGDGWVRVRLTQLPFPPVCTSCGSPTVNTVSLPLANKGQTLDVPLCGPCQIVRDRRRASALTLGVVLGVVAPFAALAVAAAFIGADAFWAMFVAVPIGILIGTIVGLVLRERANPVRFRKYTPGNGTVQLRPRDPAGGRAFALAMGLPEPP